jgi:hypothetical protein
MTRQQLVLAAASELETCGVSPFTAADLVVRAWKSIPGGLEAFGLDGYRHTYPDANAVLSTVMGKRGLVAQGLLERRGPKVYALTDKGRLAGSSKRPAVEDIKTVKLPEPTLAWLERLSGDRAFLAWRQGRQEGISFAQALHFWGGTIGPSDWTVATSFETSLVEVVRVVGDNAALLPDGTVIVRQDLQAIAECNRFLGERFSKHFKLLQNRSERGAASGR